MKKITIIDDDPGILELLEIFFERAGYEVWLEADGTFVNNNQFKLPDIFLMDRYLSGTDGLDVCKQLKSLDYSKHIPVIIMSASSDLPQAAVKACADGFIEKPFDVKHLLAVIEKHI